MYQLIVNKKMVKKNKEIKRTQKQSLKMYGKAPKSVTKNKVGKFVMCSTQNDTLQNSESRRIKAITEDFEKNLMEGSMEKLLHVLETSNLTGMSGNGFPTKNKIETFFTCDHTGKEIIVNAAECDPGLVHDQWLVDNRLEEIIAEARKLADILGVQKVTIAAKSFSSGAELAKAMDVRLYQLPVRYPMGEEHILIRQIAGIQLPASEIPAKNGILVINLQTLLSIYALLCSRKVEGKYVTLADIDNARAEVVYINYGENVLTKLQEVFGKRSGCYYGDGIFHAKPVTEDAIFDTNVSFACVTSQTADNSNTHKCKGCGRCNRVCPMGVKVKKIVALKEKDRNADISGLGVEQCLHCNTCSYVCAAKKNIFEYLE